MDGINQIKNAGMNPTSTKKSEVTQQKQDDTESVFSKNVGSRERLDELYEKAKETGSLTESEKEEYKNLIAECFANGDSKPKPEDDLTPRHDVLRKKCEISDDEPSTPKPSEKSGITAGRVVRAALLAPFGVVGHAVNLINKFFK